MTRFTRAQSFALNIVRTWWRPLSCVGLAASVWVNLVYIPLKMSKPVEFQTAAAFVGAIVAAFLVREWGKSKGNL